MMIRPYVIGDEPSKYQASGTSCDQGETLVRLVD